MNIKKTLFLLIIICISNITYGQEKPVAEEIKTVIKKIDKLINDSNYVELCKHLLYVNYDDKHRSRKDYLNSQNKEELQEAKKLANGLKRRFFNCDSYSFTKFHSQENNGTTVYAWKMKFLKSGESMSAVFALAKINGSYVLVDID